MCSPRLRATLFAVCGAFPGVIAACAVQPSSAQEPAPLQAAESRQAPPPDEVEEAAGTAEPDAGTAETPAEKAMARSCGIPAWMGGQWPTELSPTTAAEPHPLEPGTTTLVVLPDTQYYAECRSPHLPAQARWIAGEASRRNVRAVLTLGDLTEHNEPEEWEYVRDGLSLVDGLLPVVLVTGNHDHGDRGRANRRFTRLTEYFPQPRGPSAEALVEAHEPGDLENAYYRIGLPEVALGVLALEWSPRSAVVAWANDLLARHPDDRVIVITHAYLYHDGTRYDWWGEGARQRWNPLSYDTARKDPARKTSRENLHPDGAHDGELLWNALVKRHPGIFLTLNGHVLGSGTAVLTSRGEHGNAVHQILVNYQMLRDGGLGYLRLLELLPDGETLRMKTFSPTLGVFATADDQTGELRIEPPLWLPSPPAIAAEEPAPGR